MSTTICGELNNYSYNCNFPEAGGAADEIMLIPHDIINRAQGDNGFARNATNPLIITNIHIKQGEKATVFTGKRNPNSLTSAPVEQDFSSGFQHGATFNIYELSPDTANSLKALQQLKVMAILRTNQRNVTGNNIFKVAGAQVGLYLSEGNYNTNENQGVIQVTLAPIGDLLEPNPLEFFFDGTLATTQAKYEALKVEAGGAA